LCFEFVQQFKSLENGGLRLPARYNILSYLLLCHVAIYSTHLENCLHIDVLGEIDDCWITSRILRMVSKFLVDFAIRKMGESCSKGGDTKAGFEAAKAAEE
jgi:hypothetical protein